MLTYHAGVLRAYKRALLHKMNVRTLYDRMQKEAYQCSLLREKESHHRAVEEFFKNERKQMTIR